MTVLPNAPIDDATGLPVPTIAVATSGGVSVIKDTGDVVDAVGNTFDVVNNISFDSNNRIICSSGTAGTDQAFFSTFDIPSSDASSVFPGGENGYYRKGYSSTDLAKWFTFNSGSAGNHFINDVSKYGNGDIAFGTEDDGSTLNPGLKIISENITSPANGMLCGISTSYNTGWMHGDIKGAFLSDTDTTNATSGEILSNGGFTNGTTGWTLQDAGEGSISVSSNQLTLNNSTSSDPPVACYQQISLEVGKYYNVISNKASGLDVVVNITAGTSNGGGTGGYGNVIYHQNNIEQSATFLATAATMYCYIRVNTNATGTAVMNSVSIRKVEEDRSANNGFVRDKVSALTINGTITKSAVATGADLGCL